MQYQPEKATNRAGASGWAVYDIEAGHFAAPHIWKTRKACAAECQRMQDDVAAVAAEKLAELAKIAAEKAAKEQARAARVARAMAAQDMAARQLALPLPAPRQRAPKPCPVRAALMRQIERKRALMRPADPDLAQIAQHLFSWRGSVSPIHYSLDKAIVRRYLDQLVRAGLAERVFNGNPFGHRHWQATDLALRSY